MPRTILPVVLLATAIASCGGSTSFEFPPEAGPWKLDSGSISSAAGDIRFARYAGPIPIEVTVQSAPNESAAFELVQKSRPVAGAAYSYRGRYFITARSEAASAAQLSQFLNHFERAIPG
jgi:hypothetical protein